MIVQHEIKEHFSETSSIREKCLGSVMGCIYDRRSVHFNIDLEDSRINYDKTKYVIIDMQTNRYKHKSEDSDSELDVHVHVVKDSNITDEELFAKVRISTNIYKLNLN